MVVILVIRDAVASSEPFTSWIFLIGLLRKDEHLHSIIVQGVRLSQIENVELIFHALAGILHSEIIPYYDTALH